MNRGGLKCDRTERGMFVSAGPVFFGGRGGAIWACSFNVYSLCDYFTLPLSS